jgi:hypothetical protein
VFEDLGRSADPKIVGQFIGERLDEFAQGGGT